MKREDCFSELVEEAAGCQRCGRMAERQAVLGPLNGSLHPKVLFIAEAPGRNGADRTRIPFHGDSSGVNFAQLLESIGLGREEIFITNSVLCSPRKPSGANDKPTREEISNCSGFLARQIELLDPPIIATLGAVALNAIKAIAHHELTLREQAAKIISWHGRRLIPLYHPSPHVIITVRNLEQQRLDYQVIKSALEQPVS
ncbi:MAG: uracil-DNA glycosylase [Acidobacteriota bacterium]